MILNCGGVSLATRLGDSLTSSPSEEQTSSSSGWFEASRTETASVEQLKAMQAALGGAGASDVLAPPSTWDPSPDPLEHRLVDVDFASEEGRTLLAAFRASLKEREALEIVGLKRNENVSLWQRWNFSLTDLPTTSLAHTPLLCLSHFTVTRRNGKR